MSTNIRAKLSHKGKYYIPKHRYYGLKHFCLQYPDWKKEVTEAKYLHGNHLIFTSKGGVESVADAADPFLAPYILRAVSYGESFNYLKTVRNMPCSRNTFYERYRKFFWLLDSWLKTRREL